jgi:hypothetical protein
MVMGMVEVVPLTPAIGLLFRLEACIGLVLSHQKSDLARTGREMDLYDWYWIVTYSSSGFG